jgi:hypothetical protein
MKRRWGTAVRLLGDELSLNTSHSGSAAAPSIARLHLASISTFISVSLETASFRQLCLDVTDVMVILDIPRELDDPNDGFADSVCYAYRHLTNSTSHQPAQLDAALSSQRKHSLEPS